MFRKCMIGEVLTKRDAESSPSVYNTNSTNWPSANRTRISRKKRIAIIASIRSKSNSSIVYEPLNERIFVGTAVALAQVAAVEKSRCLKASFRFSSQ